LVEEGERAERTLEHYRSCLKAHLIPQFGHMRLQEITTDDVAELIAGLDRVTDGAELAAAV